MAQRRLAAIMFTDIVFYDSLLKEDEKKAFDARKKNQRIHKRLVKKFNGRWLKEMESGVLASFSSNIDAVMCAVTIQKATEELNIPLRIGIHQGDVIFEKKDVLGDGVNIASRIHSIIDTSGIIVSEKVYSDIKNKEGLEIESLGTQTLKGVDSPVGIYKVSCQNESVLDFTVDTGELVQPVRFGRTSIIIGIIVIAVLIYALYYFLPKIINPPSEQEQSILVLPCVNYIGTDTLDYFLAGMHDGMIGDIGKISALRVISTTTARTYQYTKKSMPEIATEIGVNTIIEPSVLCLGDSVCLRVKALSAYPEEKQLWVHDFKVEKSEILHLYNKVTKEISEEINAILTPQEEKRLAEARAVNIDAYDAFLRANYYWDQFSPESIQMALEYFKKAIEIDPDWAPPYAGMAYYWVAIRQSGLAPASVTIPKIYEYLDMAKKLDPNFVYTQVIDATVRVWTDFDWERGEQEMINLLEINPNQALLRSAYAHLLLILKRDKEARKQADLALELDPLNPMILSFYAVVAASTEEYEKAIEVVEKAYSIAPEHGVAHHAMAIAHVYKGDYRSALDSWIDEFYLDENTRQMVMDTYDKEGYKMAAQVLAGEAEKSEIIYPTGVGIIYVIAENDSLAMDFLEQAYEEKDANLPYIGKSMFLDGPFKIDDPRFVEFLKKMNLPLE